MAGHPSLPERKARFPEKDFPGLEEATDTQAALFPFITPPPSPSLGCLLAAAGLDIVFPPPLLLSLPSPPPQALHAPRLPPLLPGGTGQTGKQLHCSAATPEPVAVPRQEGQRRGGQGRHWTSMGLGSFLFWDITPLFLPNGIVSAFLPTPLLPA